ncbi:putative coiled coil domain protein [Candidatus Ichthyocystis hellenicum]|uniref:Putative coiled coil domain protein n=1 Tax=Candidatus Ichthyocystis hellenicum TaxID=1561003 RepID=A0A0S4M9X4_9BURK|nr:hypothetical protein [Candidatus Ichthyocystis hellenicum]CUT18292.1 putative coiled coil domain protein [Candidatus Ichthyocystis hellenicum]
MNSINPNKAGGNAGANQRASSVDEKKDSEESGSKSRLSVSSDTSNKSRTVSSSNTLPKAPSNSSEGKNLTLPLEEMGAHGPIYKTTSSESLESKSGITSSKGNLSLLSDKIKSATEKVRSVAKKSIGRIKSTLSTENDDDLRAEIRTQILSMMEIIRGEIKEAAQKRFTRRSEAGTYTISPLEEITSKSERNLLSLWGLLEQLIRSHDGKTEKGLASNLSKEQLEDISKLLSNLAAEVHTAQKALEIEQQQLSAPTSLPVAAPRIKTGANTVKNTPEEKNINTQRPIVPTRTKRDTTPQTPIAAPRTKPPRVANREKSVEVMESLDKLIEDIEKTQKDLSDKYKNYDLGTRQPVAPPRTAKTNPTPTARLGQNLQHQNAEHGTKQKPEIPPKPTHLNQNTGRAPKQKPEIPPKPTNLSQNAVHTPKQKPEIPPKPTNLSQNASRSAPQQKPKAPPIPPRRGKR